MDWTDPLSPQSLVDQIDGEGAAFGLCGDYDDEMGVVFVCEIEPKAETCFGLGDCSREVAGRRLCGVDDAHPLSAVHANRIAPGEERPSDRYRRYDEQIEAKKKAISEAHAHEFKSTMARSMRGGAIFWGGMNKDLVANRRAREIRDELRKRGR